jgi:Plavaka transposase
MIVPVILGSDKTTTSVATGDNEYYPLYLSIGNVHNNVRRAHRDAVEVVGFLSVAKSEYKYLDNMNKCLIYCS